MDFDNEMYREIIMERYKDKAFKKKIEDADASLEGTNPSCGDDITLYLKFDGDTISDVGYDGVGCSICIASADLLSEAVTGKTKEEARGIIEAFKGMLTKGEEPDFPDEISDLEALSGVQNFPVRIKCALLGWETLNQLLDDEDQKGS